MIKNTNKIIGTIEAPFLVDADGKEGDRLNLKSKLSQYVSMANIFSNGEIPELEIVAHEPEDIDKLVKFMLLGNGKED